MATDAPLAGTSPGPRFRRPRLAAAAAALLLGAALAYAGWLRARLPAPGPDPVSAWNAIAVQATDRLERGTVQARVLALAHLAMHDALNAISPRYARFAGGPPAPAGASPEAAVAAAAHAVLMDRVPGQATALEAAYAQALARVPDDASRQAGIQAGLRAAQAVLARSRGDGADRAADLAYDGAPGIGAWEPTPPQRLPALMPGWARVRPLGLASVTAVLPPPPPAPDSAEYARQYAEVQAVGARDSRVRTPLQSDVARFWSGNVDDAWNAVARQAVAGARLDPWERARLFALLNLAMSDGYIAGWAAKYRYRFWRPVTAIRQGAADGNPATRPDPDWLPYLATPEHPEYPSTHSVLSGAAAGVLACVLGDDAAGFSLAREVLGGEPGPARRYAAFSQAAEEVAFSRVWGGVHFRAANQAGLAQGRKVAAAECGLLPPLARTAGARAPSRTLHAAEPARQPRRVVSGPRAEESPGSTGHGAR